MMRPVWLAGSCLLLLAGCATPPEFPWENAQLRELTSPALRKFENREALDDYLREFSAIAEANHVWWAQALTLDSTQLLAQLDTVQTEPQCDPEIEDCGEEFVTVTAQRVAANASITNNQEASVDEGDIVKTFDRFLIVLQDGRLFSIDTGASASNLALVDRIDVYRDPEVFTWYDELLIHDDVIVVTGYSYEQDATELSVFEIDANGIFDHRVTYFIGSDDYYSGENYASRLVDGSLVLYTPIDLVEYLPDDDLVFPRIRHWTEESGYSEWQPLFGAEDIYRPILQSLEPVVHTVTVCPISLEQDWDCDSTGFIGPWQRELYVTAEHAYLWNTSAVYDWFSWQDVEDCSATAPTLGYEPAPAALYRIPLTGGEREATAVLTAGVPDDQFSLDARENEFLALLHWVPGYCDWDYDAVPMRYLRFPTSAFGTTVRELPSRSYHDVPAPTGRGIENRFAEDYLVYSGSQGRWMAYWDGDQYDYTSTELIVVPIHDPNRLRTIPLAHSAERVERFGDNIVVNGYQFNTGLSISTLDLRDNDPHLADQTYLDRVLESEGRSHAFNYSVESDGSGVMGFPTLFKDTDDSWFWDKPSNVHFLRVDPDLLIRPSGYLEAYEDAEDPSYSCDVSCYDWYGNARPIFFRDRVFALSGTELIEGRFVGGQITEIGRVNMTATPLNSR